MRMFIITDPRVRRVRIQCHKIHRWQTPAFPCMCWGAQRNQCLQDLETGCNARSLLQFHCQNDYVGTQCPVHLWDPPETRWQGLLDDLYWRQISVYWNRLSDPWWRVYTGVCVQAALLAQMKRNSSHSIFPPQDKAVCLIFVSHSDATWREIMYQEAVILVSLYSLSNAH